MGRIEMECESRWDGSWVRKGWNLMREGDEI